MKSEHDKLFEDAVYSGPGQAEFENKLYAWQKAKRWPRLAEGYGKLEGQVVVVTGAAEGQGEIEAKLLAQHGAKVYAIDINAEDLERVVNQINEDDGQAVAVVMDVTDEQGWQNLVARIKEECGRLDVLVNNAGVSQNGGVLEETKESLERIIDVDCWGVYNGMHYCAPLMIETGGGAIVNTSSFQGNHFGPGNYVGYATSKAAVGGMTRAASTDLAPYGIRVNAVCPGCILTGMTLPRQQNRKGLVEGCSMKRYAVPEEIATVVLFLASEDSSFINGQLINADGGTTTYLHLATADKK